MVLPIRHYFNSYTTCMICCTQCSHNWLHTTRQCAAGISSCCTCFKMHACNIFGLNQLPRRQCLLHYASPRPALPVLCCSTPWHHQPPTPHPPPSPAPCPPLSMACRRSPRPALTVLCCSYQGLHQFPEPLALIRTHRCPQLCAMASSSHLPHQQLLPKANCLHFRCMLLRRSVDLFALEWVG